MIKLSIVDYVSVGECYPTAVANTVRLASLAESCGYRRFWIAEHHDDQMMAASPEILIAAVASRTTSIRVGAGCVLLNFHSAWKVAETFKTLSALFPNRMDLGVGRGGADGQAGAALLDGRPRRSIVERQTHYERKVAELISYLPLMSADHPGPELWLLGSGTSSAELAAGNGTAVCLGQFFGPGLGDSCQTLANYRAAFCPGNVLRPTASISVSGVCAATDEAAAQILASLRNRFLAERANFCGSPETCARFIRERAAEAQVDEVVVLPLCETYADQARMYGSLAEAMCLSYSAGPSLSSAA